MTDWELWACACKMLDEHRDDAAVFAAMRADALLDAGNLAGHGVWCVIVSRIETLGTAIATGATRH